eukprot:765535-Hanusia_phi.AAC.2
MRDQIRRSTGNKGVDGQPRGAKAGEGDIKRDTTGRCSRKGRTQPQDKGSKRRQGGAVRYKGSGRQQVITGTAAGITKRLFFKRRLLIPHAIKGENMFFRNGLSLL